MWEERRTTRCGGNQGVCMQGVGVKEMGEERRSTRCGGNRVCKQGLVRGG